MLPGNLRIAYYELRVLNLRPGGVRHIALPSRRSNRPRPSWHWAVGLVPAGGGLAPSQLVHHTHLAAFWWSGPMLLVIGALIESVDARCDRNPSDDEREELQRARVYRWFPLALVVITIAAFVIAAYMWAQPALSLVDKVGLAVTIGITSGFGINVAHELGHRRERHERWLGKVALAQNWYGHFAVEHGRGHHVHVATPLDPVSARFGETYWHFLGRSLVGEFRFALSAERERLARRGTPWYSAQNQILQGWMLSACLFGGLIAVFGVQILPYLLIQAAVGLAFLECVNYIEHYGLLRLRLPDGRYERCWHGHSWNSTKRITGLGVFNLERHSDHHVHPGRRYQSLAREDTAPELPGGYAQMVFAALIPPLWRRIMDRRVLALCGDDIRRTNLTDALRAVHGPAPLAVRRK